MSNNNGNEVEERPNSYAVFEVQGEADAISFRSRLSSSSSGVFGEIPAGGDIHLVYCRPSPKSVPENFNVKNVTDETRYASFRDIRDFGKAYNWFFSLSNPDQDPYELERESSKGS